MSTPIDAPALQRFLRDDLLNGRSVEVDEDLLLSGLVDSLGVMSLVGFLEEQRGAPIPHEDITLENFTSISAILSYLSDERP